jgi:hypothetical protein
MRLNKLIYLDKEEDERIANSIESSNNLLDILKYDKIKRALSEDILLIQGSPINPMNIASSLPLYSFVFFELCPDCMPNIEIIKPLLDSDSVFPILLKGYQDCPEPFVTELIKYPHMTVQEFMTLRFHALSGSLEKVACHHCVMEVISNDIQLHCKSFTDDYKKTFQDLVTYTIAMLSPFSSLDDELLMILKEILQKGNLDNFSAFMELSSLIGRIRTAAAFDSPLSISSKIIKMSDTNKYVPKDLNDIMQFSDDIIIKGLELDIPHNLDMIKYIDIIMNNREQIKKLTNRLIKRVSKHDKIENTDISLLMNEIATINEKIRMVQKSKKYKLYKIGTDLLSANKGLISSLLCATMLGIYGNLTGCGISASAGIVGKIFKSSERFNSIIKNISAKQPIQELKELILDSLEPPFQRILSIYFWKDLKVIQAMRIREKIHRTS